MEAADVMYGITMADAGISKIISVKMTEAEE
jgi:chromosome segregation ATPase